MDSIKTVFNVFTLLLARFPVWVLLIALFTKERISPGSFAVLFFAIVLARGCLYARENNKGPVFSTFYSLWRNFIRPVLIIIPAEITCFGILYALFAGGLADMVIILTAFALFIVSYALGVFIKKPATARRNTLLKRSFALRALLALLWLYFIFQPDGQLAAACALFAIYFLEYFSTYEIIFEEKWGL